MTRYRYGLGAPLPDAPQPDELLSPAEGASIPWLWSNSPRYRKGVYVGAGIVGALWLGAIVLYKVRKR